MPGTQASIGDSMMAVVTTGAGGYEKLEFKQVPVPKPGPRDVLLEVLAAGINNTDINTRIGWYSSSVTVGTEATGADAGRADGGWSGTTPYPLIQGVDCCGRIVAVGPGGDERRLGSRVIVRSCMRRKGFGSMETTWLGVDFDGAFAEYVKVPESEAFPVECDWSDAELASIPCAYGTAENMLHRAGIGEGMWILVPGASGGVASAVVQLARRRGAKVIAVTSASKRALLEEIGANRVLTRRDDLLNTLGAESVDVVVDNVAGPGFGSMLKVLKRGGRYVTSGAITGPIVALDMRDVYLKDLTFIGCTAWDAPVFPNLISYIEKGEIRPIVASTYPIEKIADAQRAFQEKRHVGKIVLTVR